jgi:hypothetical protein
MWPRTTRAGCVGMMALPIVLLVGCAQRSSQEVAAIHSAESTYGPLPDPCPDGQNVDCDESGCSCGVAPTDPASCDATYDCQSDADCGDGKCCFHGSCTDKSGSCSCGDTEWQRSSSAAPGCPGSDSFVQMMKDEAQQYCVANAPMFGNQCSSLGQCVGSAVIGATNLQCIDTGDPQMGGMIAIMCMHCDEADPPDAPPNNSGACNDLQVQIANKKADINTKQKEAAYLADGIAKLDGAIASYATLLASLQDAESKVISGTFGDNITVKTSGEVTKFVTDIYGGAKAVTSLQKIGCLGQRAYCGTNLFGKVPNYSWKNVIYSKKAWGEVYEPAAAFGMAKVAGGAACPGDPPDDSWFSWWPGLSSAKWLVGCWTKDSVIQQIGENRTNATNAKLELTNKRKAMSDQRDQLLIDIGKLQSELDALQKKYDDTCGCNHS